jgi:NADH:ubiquinone oxidoreductase subunit 5 (subunit L)/multisubunit Na+/H+ antiporter MnhA subunit
MLLSETAAPGGLFSLAPLIVFLPVLGLLVNMFFGGRFSEKVIGWIASAATGLAFVVSVLLAVALVGHPEGVTVPWQNGSGSENLRLIGLSGLTPSL